MTQEIIKDLKNKIELFEFAITVYKGNSAKDIIIRTEAKKELESLKIVLNIYERELKNLEKRKEN